MKPINEDIFETIDTKEKAYWIGFLYADGSVASKGRRIGFHLSYKDVIMLEKFCDFIGGDRSRVISYDGNKTVFFYVYSDKMRTDLTKYHIVPNKTYKKEFPIFEDEELFLAFFLGVYDGDGTEGSSTLASGNKDFLEYCCDRFSISKDKIRNNINRYGSCYSLNIGCNNYMKTLMNYGNSLERKRRTGSKYFPSSKNIIFSKEKIKLGQCVDCDTIISSKSKRCAKCAMTGNHNLSNRGNHTNHVIKFNISVENLKDLVKVKTLTDIGMMFNVHAESVRRRCKELGITYNTDYVGYFKSANSKRPRKFEATKEELEALINEKPMTEIGKMYGVSDNAIKKRCKSLGIELKPMRGYWVKQKAIKKGE